MLLSYHYTHLFTCLSAGRVDWQQYFRVYSLRRPTRDDECAQPPASHPFAVHPPLLRPRYVHCTVLYRLLIKAGLLKLYYGWTQLYLAFLIGDKSINYPLSM